MPQDQEPDMDAISERIKSDQAPPPDSATQEEACKVWLASATEWLISRIALSERAAMNHMPHAAMWAVPELSASDLPHGQSDTPNDTPDKSSLLLRGLGR